MYKLLNDLKSRKYRRNPDLLDEKVISCSQHSVLQSEDDALSECLSQDGQINFLHFWDNFDDNMIERASIKFFV